jgi:biotin-(acetyl-CoA carboxylase) ligase
MVSGTVSGIDSTGALLIKTADGSIRTILSGDIVKH